MRRETDKKAPHRTASGQHTPQRQPERDDINDTEAGNRSGVGDRTATAEGYGGQATRSAPSTGSRRSSASEDQATHEAGDKRGDRDTM